MLNKTFVNSNDLEFKVIELERTDKNHKKYYNVKFTKTGYVAKNVRTDTIRGGLVRDKLQTTLFGVGVIGYANTRQEFKKYNLWKNMLARCYDKRDKSYRYYGLRGVTVCDRWKRYDYFLEDIVKVNGYNEKLYNEGKLFLDKDINSKCKKIYSLETCEFISDYKNQQQRTKEYNFRNKKVVIYKNGKEEYIENLSKFCKERNLSQSQVYKCLRNEIEEYKGLKFLKQ